MDNPICPLCPLSLYHHRCHPCHNLNNNDDHDNLIGAMSSATLVRPLLPRCRCVKCRLADYTLTCCTSIVIVIINVIDMNTRVLRLLVHPVQVSVAFGIACMEGTSAVYIVLSVCQLHKWICKCVRACLSVIIIVWSDRRECIISVSSGWTEPTIRSGVYPPAWLEVFWKYAHHHHSD